MNMLTALFIAVSADPLKGFRQGMADVILLLLGIVAMVSLVVTVIHIAQGDQEAGKKMARWLVGCVVGAIIIVVIKNL